MKYKIFENGNIKKVLKKMLKEGYVPLNSKQTFNWKQKNKYNGWIDTRTLFIKGEFRDATINELKNIKETYKKGGRLVFLNDNDDGFFGYGNINNVGRFLGVKNNG